MSVDINITVEDIATQIATYTGIQLYSASSVSGSYSLVTTISLVAGTVYYSYTDSAGTLSTWYKYRYHSGSADSAYSNPFQPEGISRLLIRQTAIETYRAGLVLSASASNQSTTVEAFEDYRLDSSFYATNRGKGALLHPVTGSRALQSRRVVSSTNAGLFTVNPALDGALASGDQVEMHWLATPDEWNNAINHAMERYYYLDRVPIKGEDTPEIVLDYLPWLLNRSQITGLWYYPDSSMIERAWGSRGNWWSVRQENGVVTLMTAPTIASTDTVYLEAVRPMPSLFTDDSVLPAGANMNLCAALTYDEVLRAKIQPSSMSAATDRAVFAQALAAHQSEVRQYIQLHKPRPRYQAPQPYEPLRVSTPWTAR